MYTVIEHTAGYLPEDDDPPIFQRYEEAMEYLVERRRELFEDDMSYSYPPEDKDDGFTRHLELEIGEIGDGSFAYSDNRQTYPLPRYVEIIPVEETCPTCGLPDNCGDCTHTRDEVTVDPPGTEIPMATDDEINRSFDAYRT